MPSHPGTLGRARHVGAFSLLLAAVAACSGDGSALVAPDTAPLGETNPSGGSAISAAGTIAGAKLWVNPESNARATADAWRAASSADAAQMDKIAAQSQAIWIGDWNRDVRSAVGAATTTATATGAVPVFVAYNIPQRDCGGLSGANGTGVDGYRRWIGEFAAGIGVRRAVVVLEPDALAAMGCLSSGDQQTRVDLLRFAVQTFAALGQTFVYLDAGHPRWQTAATMASRLDAAGVDQAAGFTLNVSNFIGTAENITYGQQLSALVGGKHFLVDTGRNGAGPTTDGQWCNPSGRALGDRPTTVTGVTGVDAYLWIKSPGESDGACGGAPAAGVWMPEYALGLAQRAG